jgi:hypothetical protein
MNCLSDRLPLPAGAFSEFYLVALSGCVQAGWVECDNGMYRLTKEGEAARKQGLKEPIR